MPRELCVGGEIVVLDRSRASTSRRRAVLATPRSRLVLTPGAGRRDPARSGRTDAERVRTRRRGTCGFGRRTAPPGCCRGMKFPSPRPHHARGRAAADPGAALYAPRTSELRPLADEIPRRACARQGAWRGARGGRADRRARRRARPRGGLAPAPAPAGRKRGSARRARAGRGERHREREDRPGARSSRPDARRVANAAAGAASWQSRGLNRNRATRAPTCSRRSSAAATRPRSGSRSPSACRPSPWTDRRRPSRRRWCVPARRRPGWPTS